MKYLILFFCLIVSPVTVIAIDSQKFASAEQQETYESLTSQLRCLVCQNQTIADSNAELAADLRRQVHEMLDQGKSKDEIIQFMTERYGDFVLYNPPFKAKTGLLWLGPALFLLIGLITVFLVIRRKKKTAAVTITAEQQEKIHSLLEKGDLS